MTVKKPFRVIHGDCNERLSFYPDNYFDLIVTDMPYGIDYVSHKQNCDTRGLYTVKVDRPEYFTKIEGDSSALWLGKAFWLEQSFRVLKEGSAIYIFCHWSKWNELYQAVQGVGFTVKNMIVMNKSNHGMGDLRGSYAPKHELLLFAAKGRHILKFKKRMKDIWDVKVKFSGTRRYHPTEKPVEWMMPCLLNSSSEGDLVLDPFCGSGSTGVACMQLNRKVVMIDIDPDCCNIARERCNEAF